MMRLPFNIRPGEKMGFVIPTLKILALKGASDHMITISTTELGEELGVSQQTASNRLLALLEAGLIERHRGTRDHSIGLTKEGLGLLRREYGDYQRIFDVERHIRITGKVSAGLGEGQYYLKRSEYKKQLSTKLGFVPYEGTLNLTVTMSELAKLDMLPGTGRIHIDGFKAEGRTFGTASCIPVQIGNVKAAIVLPKRSHHSQVLEIISATYLRNKFSLKDGDELTLDIEP